MIEILKKTQYKNLIYIKLNFSLYITNDKIIKNISNKYFKFCVYVYVCDPSIYLSVKLGFNLFKLIQIQIYNKFIIRVLLTCHEKI